MNQKICRVDRTVRAVRLTLGAYTWQKGGQTTCDLVLFCIYNHVSVRDALADACSFPEVAHCHRQTMLLDDFTLAAVYVLVPECIRPTVTGTEAFGQRRK